MSTIKQIKKEIQNIANIYQASVGIATDYVKVDCPLEDEYRTKILDCLTRESCIIQREFFYKKQRYCISMGSPREVKESRNLFHTLKSLVWPLWFNFELSYILEEGKTGWTKLQLQPDKKDYHDLQTDIYEYYRLDNRTCYSRYSHPFVNKKTCFINMCYASLWSEPLL